jgi:hypothetical protein
MMSRAMLMEILKLCLSIENVASDAYLTLSNFAKEAELKKFWQEMANEEDKHGEYWETLIKLAEKGRIANVFDKPNRIVTELEEARREADMLMKGGDNLDDITTSFLIAYRIEFYLLHPAFAALFHLMRKETGDKSPEDDYDNHINKFITAVWKFGAMKPELELAARLSERLWLSNRRLAIQLGDIRTLRSMMPICVHCKKIRADDGYWNQVELYIEKHMDVRFTHSICPECFEAHYSDPYK